MPSIASRIRPILKTVGTTGSHVLFLIFLGCYVWPYSPLRYSKCYVFRSFISSMTIILQFTMIRAALGAVKIDQGPCLRTTTLTVFSGGFLMVVCTYSN